MGSLNSWGPGSSTAGRPEDRLHGVQLVGPNGFGGWGRATHRRGQQAGGGRSIVVGWVVLGWRWGGINIHAINLMLNIKI